MTNRLSMLFLGILIGILIVILLACQPVPPVSTNPVTTTAVTTTVPSSGSDDTAALQNTLNVSKYLYVNREYRVDGILTPPAGSKITFGPNGRFTRTAAGNGGGKSVLLLKNSNITVENPYIVGPNPCYWKYFDTNYTYSQYNPQLENNHAISISGGSGYVITNPKIRNVWGDAIYLAGNSKNITINNLDAACLGRSVISNVGSENVTVNGGKSYGAFWWTFNMEPWGDYVVRNYKVNNFQVGWSRYHAVFAGGPNFNCQVFDVDFTNLVVTDPRGGTNDFSIAACADVVIK
jgi:hypothetical protein